MNILQAIILGIVQGLTEFIPVSSTAHLIFATRLTGLSQALAAEQQTAVIAVIQLGTLAAVFVYFARDIWNICYAFVRDHLLLLRGKTPPGIEGSGVAVTVIHPGFIRTPMTANRKKKLPFLLEADDAACRIIKAVERRARTYAFPWQLASLVRVIRHMPGRLYDRLASKSNFRE